MTDPEQPSPIDAEQPGTVHRSGAGGYGVAGGYGTGGLAYASATTIEPQSEVVSLNAPSASTHSVAVQGGVLTLTGGSAELKITRPSSAAVGRAVIANRDAVLVQASSIELLLSGAIDRAREARSNSGNVPELETILVAVRDLRVMLLETAAAPAEAGVGVQALSVKDGLAKWWAKDPVSILDRGYNMGLFLGGLILIGHFGLLPATIVASLIRGRDIAEAIKAAADLLKSIGRE